MESHAKGGLEYKHALGYASSTHPREQPADEHEKPDYPDNKAHRQHQDGDSQPESHDHQHKADDYRGDVNEEAADQACHV